MGGDTNVCFQALALSFNKTSSEALSLHHITYTNNHHQIFIKKIYKFLFPPFYSFAIIFCGYNHFFIITLKKELSE